MKVLMIAAAMMLFAGSIQAQNSQTAPDTRVDKMPGMSPACPPMSGQNCGTPKSSQEPENQPRRGESLPQPELLKAVVTRPQIELADFIQLADDNNPTLNEAQAIVRRSEAQARQSGLYPNPSVGYLGEQIRGGSYGGGEQGGFVQQTIVLGGKLGLRREIYKQQSLSLQFGVQEQTYRLHDDVAQAFYAALASQFAVVLHQRLLGLALDAVETVHQLANVGQADAPDILQTEVEAERAKVDFVTAQRQFLADFHALAALAGKPDLPVCPLGGDLEDLPELDPEQQAAEIMALSPSLKRAEQEVAEATARLRDAKRESMPDLELRAGEQYNREQIVQQPTVKATGMQSFASAAINIPLWNRNQGNIGAAEAELELARQEVTRTKLSLRAVAEPLVQSYLSARSMADRYKTELIPRAQNAYQLYMSKYQNMAQAYPQVLVSQRTLFELQIDYLHALREVWANAIALKNYGLSGGLEGPMPGALAGGSLNLPDAGAAQPQF